MKKGLRFQTRLMLAFLFATSLVSFAVIQLTSDKVKRTYQRQFKDKFESEISYLLEARERRWEAQFTLGKKLAASEFVIRQLTGTGNPDRLSQGRSEFLAKFPTQVGLGGGPGERKGRGNDAFSRLNRILAVMDMEGTITYISAPPEKNSDRKKTRYRSSTLQRKLEDLEQNDSQQIGYFPQKLPGGVVIRDIIVTPVKNPGSGEMMGAFLMGLTTVETREERFLDRYHQEVNDTRFENAIFLEDSLYPSVTLGAIQKSRQENETEYDFFESEIAKEINRLPEGQIQGNFEFQIREEPHLVHFCALNPESPLATAWQVSAFPISELKADLNDLRIKGSGIGLVGILIGLIAAWFLSRKLSIPIRELSEGTRQIREGHLDTKLPIRSRDEIGELTRSFNEMTDELRQKELYRSLLEKVSDESVAQAMIEGSLNPELGGELKRVSVLFCDIRGFTDLTESMRPEDVIEVLNRHMTAMTRVVREHFGVVDKFVGDEIMAVFGGLKSYGNDAANAALCAVKMIQERERLNREHGTDIQIGIGIATGEIVAGCMGSEDRLNYTVLGARVNLGARLCGRAGAGEIVIDDETFAQIEELNPVTQVIEGLLLKGFSSEIPAWKLTSAQGSSSPLFEQVT